MKVCRIQFQKHTFRKIISRSSNYETVFFLVSEDLIFIKSWLLAVTCWRTKHDMQEYIQLPIVPGSNSTSQTVRFLTRSKVELEKGPSEGS